MSDKTFTRTDIQTWIDTLGEREQAMLAHVIGEAEYRAGIQVLGAAVESMGVIARQHASEGKRKASKAVRDVMGAVLRVQRDMEATARHYSQVPAEERH